MTLFGVACTAGSYKARTKIERGGANAPSGLADLLLHANQVVQHGVRLLAMADHVGLGYFLGLHQLAEQFHHVTRQDDVLHADRLHRKTQRREVF